MKKYLFGLVPLTIIALASVAIWWYLSLSIQPNNGQQNNNQNNQNGTQEEVNRYTNTEFGFEFQYPKDWEVKENTFGSYYSKFNLVVNPKFVRSSNFTVALNIVLPEFPELSFKNIEKTISDVIVDGISGVEYRYEFEDLQERAIILPFGEYNLILSTDSMQYIDTFNQVVSSFKFLK
ncbi:MAG: PsbP-related protein [Candidatus Hodarchaeota archaeon]